MKKIILLSLIVFVSCTGKKASVEDFYKHFPNIQKAKTETLPFDINEFKNPTTICYYDGKIITAEDNTSVDTLISVFNLSTYKSVGNYISNGNGPNEFLDVTNLQRNGNNFFFYDWSAKKIVNFNFFNDTVSMCNILKLKPDSTIIYSFFNVFPVDNHYYLATGILPENRIVIIDSLGKNISSFGIYPLDENKQPTPVALGFGHQGVVSANKESTRCAIFGAKGASYSFYDISNIDDPRLIVDKVFTLPVYNDISNEKSRAVVFDSKLTTQGVLCTAKSEKYCICLYSGVFLKDLDNLLYGDKLLIFDWDGNPVKILELDSKYCSITYSEENKKLYLLGIDARNYDFKISTLNFSDI